MPVRKKRSKPSQPATVDRDEAASILRGHLMRAHQRAGGVLLQMHNMIESETAKRDAVLRLALQKLATDLNVATCDINAAYNSVA